jgi:hypothetical protein
VGRLSAFHDEQLHRRHFLVREEGGQPAELVPLVHDTENNRYLLYGGSYPDARILWVEYVFRSSSSSCRTGRAFSI